MQKERMWAGMVAAAGMAALASAQGLPPGPMPTPTMNVGPVAAVKAANPAPSAMAKNQTQKTSLGVRPASVKASGPSAYWTDLVDIDGDGVEEDTQFLFDKQRGILYTYKQDAYQCGDGSSQNGAVLMAIYTQGNNSGKASGSGWYVVAVKAGQCGEKKAGLFGCRFDASGKPTTCGTAKVKEESGEVDLVVKK
jgi:hypothetical protein